VVSFLLDFSPISYMRSSLPTIHVTFLAHLIILYLIVVMKLCEDYSASVLSLYTFLLDNFKNNQIKKDIVYWELGRHERDEN
jgi:hypothetical protein